MTHNMEGMNNTGATDMHMDMPQKMMMTHMTFFWGQSTEILFTGWPGQSFQMYVIALIFVFLVCMLVEWLSHSRLIKPGMNNIVAGLLQTVMYAIRVGLAFLVMLAVMSFNIPVMLVVIAGYATGFLLFGSKVFENVTSYEKATDLPPFNC